MNGLSGMCRISPIFFIPKLAIRWFKFKTILKQWFHQTRIYLRESNFWKNPKPGDFLSQKITYWSCQCRMESLAALSTTLPLFICVPCMWWRATQDKAKVTRTYTVIVLRPENEACILCEGHLVMPGPFSHFRNPAHTMSLLILLPHWNACHSHIPKSTQNVLKTHLV